MGSKGNGKHFVGLHFAWHGLESCCCLSVSKALRQKHRLQRFSTVFDAGDSRAFSAFRGLESCCLCGCFESASAKARPATMCNGLCDAGVRVFQHCASSKGLCQWLRNQNYASQAIGCRTKELINVCFFMGSKGNGKHFVGLHFAWHGLESCCCLSVSKALRQKHRLQRFSTVFDAGDSRAFSAFRGLESCCLCGCFESASAKARPATICNGLCDAGVRVFQNCASSIRDCANGFGIRTMPRRL